MEKLYFSKDLNGFEAIKIIEENLKLNRSCELYCGDTYISYSDENGKFDITSDKVTIDNVTKNNWCVRITDYEVEESDMIDLKNLSLIELKKEIARLSNKYDLDFTVWENFNITNTEIEAHYSFAIAFADYREYSYEDIAIIREYGDDFDVDDDENLNDYEKHSTRWSIRYKEQIKNKHILQ